MAFKPTRKQVYPVVRKEETNAKDVDLIQAKGKGLKFDKHEYQPISPERPNQENRAVGGLKRNEYDKEDKGTKFANIGSQHISTEQQNSEDKTAGRDKRLPNDTEGKVFKSNKTDDGRILTEQQNAEDKATGGARRKVSDTEIKNLKSDNGNDQDISTERQNSEDRVTGAGRWKVSDTKITHLIESMLKTTPHLAMSLSLKSNFAVESAEPEQMEKALPRVSIKSAKNNLQTELSRSQREKLFLELKQAKDSIYDANDADDEDSLTDDEQREFGKIMNSLKNMEILVAESIKCEKGQYKDLKSNERSGDKREKDWDSYGEKSAKFVQKFDTKEYSASTGNLKSKDELDEEDLEALVNLSLEESDYTLCMDANFNGETMVPRDSRVLTSHLGRRSGCRSAVLETLAEPETEELIEAIQWKRGNLLGKGAFGKVWCGLTNKGELIAVKQIELKINDMEQAEVEYEKIQEEVELLKTLKHPNIIGYLGTSLEENFVNIFMQFVPGGSIANILARFGALEEAVFCHYTKQILKGVAHLHKNNVIHRDIKGGNIMVMHNGIIKLIDFGCAKRLCLKIKAVNNDYLLKSMRGTPYWMAPEVVNETGYGTKSDIWSIGCTVFEMATRKPPWAELPPLVAVYTIGSDSATLQFPNKMSREARGFIRHCMTRNQESRPSAVELLLHPFVQRT